MRTVVENRYGLDRISECENTSYRHLNHRTSKSKSSFYDFGEKRQIRFVECEDDEKSEFIESLAEQFCN